MYFSRVRLRTDVDNGAMARRLCQQDSYQEHQILWRLFGEDPTAERDFLFRRTDINGWPQFYLVSQRLPGLEDPIWHVDSQTYHPRIYHGQRFLFSLRANPVVTRKGPAGERKRHDVIMDLKKKRDWKKLPVGDREPMYTLVQEAAVSWLSPRLKKSGARLDAVTADSYLQHQNYKKGKSKAICYSTLDMTGLLSVSDPDMFIGTLYHGIGPAKAFGCGLLLIRRA
jgi:CRISPR system Cascade subunit CasE